MKKRPTENEIMDLLTQPHFRREEDEAEPSNDPITKTQMTVEVDRIKPYDRNPRRDRNPEYEAIKASIRASGMDQPLVVTKRPGDDLYMVAAGGNTRLLILQELWQETGDPRFGKVDCLFRPWQGDADTLVAHLKENDLRGDLTFIDRALAVRELRQLIEEETGEQLSYRQLSRALEERGYRVTRSLIIQYDYTVEVLYPAIPESLRAGMGRPQVEAIRALEQAFARVWEALEQGDRNAARMVFVEVLGRHDGEILDLDLVRRALETELAVGADTEVQRVSLLLGAALDGRDLGDLRQEASGDGGASGDDATGDIPAPAPAAVTGIPGGGEPADGEPAASDEDEPAPGGTDLGPGGAEPAGAPGTSGEEPDAREHAPAAASEATPLDGLDLEELRERACELAAGIAERAHMPGIVHRIPAGVGYLVEPVGLRRAMQTLSKEIRPYCEYVWWLIAQVSEQFAPGTRALEYLPPGFRDRAPSTTRIIERITQNQPFSPKLATIGVGEVPLFSPPMMAPLALAIMPDDIWRDYVALVETYREIFKRTNFLPWGRNDGQERV